MKTLLTYSIVTLLALLLVTGCNQLPINPVLGGGKNVKPPITTIGNYELHTGSGETKVYDISGRTKQWVATFTTNSRTVTMHGDYREFEEYNTVVGHDTWVRLLNAPFAGNVDINWMEARLGENTNQANVPDIIAIAMEYADGGQLNATYGPNEGADWNDFLGVPHLYVNHWSHTSNKYIDYNRPFNPNYLGSLDCSGFLRMVYGHRGGIPMIYNPDPANPNGGFPRRSYMIWDSCIGKRVMVGYVFGGMNAEEKLDQINIGDIVVFDADSSSQAEIGRIDHVGFYLGRDTTGNMRFMHSRSSANRGPTFTLDTSGKSILNNDGTNSYLYYAKALKGARRL